MYHQHCRNIFLAIKNYNPIQQRNHSHHWCTSEGLRLVHFCLPFWHKEKHQLPFICQFSHSLAVGRELGKNQGKPFSRINVYMEIHNRVFCILLFINFILYIFVLVEFIISLSIYVAIYSYADSLSLFLSFFRELVVKHFPARCLVESLPLQRGLFPY